MTVIKESRSFFLRNTPKLQGTDKDNEVGFPTKNKVKRLFVEEGKIVEKYIDTYNRFLEGNVPSPKVWEKLLHSVVFHNDNTVTQQDIETFQTQLDNIQAELNAISVPDITQLTADLDALELAFNQLQTIVSNNTTDINTIFNNRLAVLDQSILNLENYINTLDGEIDAINLLIGTKPNEWNDIYTEISGLKGNIASIGNWFSTSKAQSYYNDGLHRMSLSNASGSTFIDSSNVPTINLVNFTPRKSSTLYYKNMFPSSVSPLFTSNDPDVKIFVKGSIPIVSTNQSIMFNIDTFDTKIVVITPSTILTEL